MPSKFLKHSIATETQLTILQQARNGEKVERIARKHKMHPATIASLVKLGDIKFHNAKPHRCGLCGTLISTTVCVACSIKGMKEPANGKK